MSADNGIYIGKFKDGYRIVLGFAVENLDFFEKGTFNWCKDVRNFFKGGHLEKTFEKAMEYSFEFEKKYGYTEYGICEIGDFSEYDIFDEKDTFEINKQDLIDLGFQQCEQKNCYYLEVDTCFHLFFEFAGGNEYILTLQYGDFGKYKKQLNISSLFDLKNFLYTMT